MSSGSLPPPKAGDVIRYAYLWSHEVDAGREEAAKDRPRAVVLLIRKGEDGHEVAVLPITSTPPADAAAGVEIPGATRARLGLQGSACWIIVSEINLFHWPGPDVRPVAGGPAAFTYGMLPLALQKRARAAFVAWRESRAPRLIRRDD